MPFYLNWRKRIGLALTSNEGAPTMNQLRTAIDVLKVELVTEEKHQKLVPTIGERIVHTGGSGDTQGIVTSEYGPVSGQGRILIRQKVSQSDLAAMAGVARENVSRALNEASEHVPA